MGKLIKSVNNLINNYEEMRLKNRTTSNQQIPLLYESISAILEPSKKITILHGFVKVLKNYHSEIIILIITQLVLVSEMLVI